MRHFCFIVLFLIALSGSAFAGERVVLNSLEWPPYTGRDLPMQGATSAIVREAFKAVGYEVEIRFLPWNRAMASARYDDDVDGYFPEYPDKKRMKEFLCSNGVGKSLIGFAKRRARTFKWLSYPDLSHYRIGVVDGYVNADRFDQMVADGDLKVDTSVSDVLNLRKVLESRIDVAVVDANVYEFYLAHDPMLRSRKDELSIESRLLAIHDLIVCFKAGSRGRELAHIFNEGLQMISPRVIQEDIIDYINFGLDK